MPRSRSLSILGFAAALLCGGGTVFAAKLDLTSEVGLKSVSFNNLNFATSDPTKDFFYLQTAALGIGVKDLRPMQSGEMTMDVNLRLRAYGVSGSTAALAAPYGSIASRYPGASMMPYIENAYMKVNRLFDWNLAMQAGRMPFMLASGLTLDDDHLGLTGFTLKREKIFNEFDLQFFALQPKADDSVSKSVNLAGLNMTIPGEGVWELYSYFDFDKNSATAASGTAVSARTLQFTGLSYTLKYGFLSFCGEGVLQSGSANKTDGTGTINYNGSAFFLSGKWVQPFGRFGTGEARLTYGHGSGDKYSTENTDEAFFPDYGHRYNGLERSGYGELFAATLYDAFGGNSSTKTGLPGGVSGIQVVNLGITLPAYHNIYISLDYFSYEADRNANNDCKMLGSELDLKFNYPIGQTLNLSLSYAKFAPGSIYDNGTPSPNKLAVEAFAKF
ncbi:MAG: hypothetical protein PHW69_09570 [Elusimicrobiaceae bacterium]|nr:hypothetical protein [Elusimicrobiaceae bacterium]